MALCCLFFDASAYASSKSVAKSKQTTTEDSSDDKRIRFVWYDPYKVVTIPIVLGVGTHVVFAPDEKILTTAPGVGADCKSEVMTWCIVSNNGDNQFFVKAKSTTTVPNNADIVTNKRTYSFDFPLLKPTQRNNAVFRVVFKYPDFGIEDGRGKLNAEEQAAIEKARADAEERKKIEDRLAQGPVPRNWKYSKQALSGSESITPTEVFDDGRFTYLKFDGNRQVPEVFAIESDKTEALVQTHMEGDVLVIHRVWKQFVLRSGQETVGIWNDDYDLVGVEPVNGVTVNGLKRLVKGDSTQ